MIDVWVEYMTGIYPPSYMVIVDGKVYDSFICRDGVKLTWAQQCDVAHMYRQALDPEC